jgi:hypothetical protein
VLSPADARIQQAAGPEQQQIACSHQQGFSTQAIAAETQLTDGFDACKGGADDRIMLAHIRDCQMNIAIGSRQHADQVVLHGSPPDLQCRLRQGEPR